MEKLINILMNQAQNIQRMCKIKLFGSETRLVSNIIILQVVFINKWLRIICKIYWPNNISNMDRWSLSNEEPIITQIKLRKWRWIGHTLRTNTDLDTIAIFEGECSLDWRWSMLVIVTHPGAILRGLFCAVCNARHFVSLRNDVQIGAA